MACRRELAAAAAGIVALDSPGPRRVAAVVLNWNNLRESRACIGALLSSSYPHLDIVLVDNHSTDGSFEALAAEFPEVQRLRNAENAGFSRGCNVGMRLALADPRCAFVLLVNNDCTVAPTSIAAAVAAMDADAGIGVVTGKIVDERNRIWHAGGTISLLRGQSRTRGFRAPDRGQFDSDCDTEWASGAMMLVRRSTLETVGLLPEEYFFGVEEWDFSLAVRKGGYRIRYVWLFAGVHPGGGSHDNHDPRFAYNYYRNKLIFQEKYLGRMLFRAWLIPFRLYVAFRMRRHVSHLASITYASPIEDRSGALVFAARCAIRDHGKDVLSESALARFGAELEAMGSRVP